ncbi:zf-HC2 domain-containing protein [Muricomes sp. OA1]|uniref:Anti-sigma-W factor RsiW n=1 Tax=Hungatella hathewayi TaxID=154046 RepID=A0A3E2X0V5_9FIRM|nr:MULTISPECIES: zf-HC2 domain-containing protein [Clostridia]MCH1971301.1 zf-HC2 domain-containing protein [Muricomes sp. OA1]RGC34905.1 zf-HC2 domain-containing protein [Hungatella hathewayi]GKH34599.1 hypothetical protein CE91St64_40060 [Faecalicatena contorta]
MKCEMIRDLLPLYIDGLTSEESNKEIDKHLKTCRECREYYREMTGEISEAVPISEEEIQDVELIKKIKRQRRKRILGVVCGAVLVLAMLTALLLPRFYSHVKFDEVKLNYGTRGNIAYIELETKPGYEIYFTGTTKENESYLKVLSIRKIGGTEKDISGWEDEIGTKEDPCKWTIEFEDKIVVFENGELVEQKDK